MIVNPGNFILSGKYRHFHNPKKLFNLKSFPSPFFLSLRNESKGTSDYHSGKKFVSQVWDQECYHG
jgi:hypothetical protein